MPTNRRVVEEDHIDFYPTPAWATKALLENEEFFGSVWEPACGDGAMSEVIKKYYPLKNVYSSDLYAHGYGDLIGVDFLSMPNDKQTDNVITNPPYEIANEFVLKALQVSQCKVAMLVRLAFLEGQERYQTIFKDNPPIRVWVFSERITMYKKSELDENNQPKMVERKGKMVKAGSGTTAYGWFIWENGYKGPTYTKWLAPGYKP